MRHDRLFFASDYMEGAHPVILKRLTETNLERTPGYGTDAYSEAARAKIRAVCRAPEAEIHFLVGGTQANATVIDAMLLPWQGVIAARTGHISVHEAGAIEFGGHKVLTLEPENGKLTATRVRRCFEAWRDDANRDHMVMPGLVYVSQPTECGTLYTLGELQALSDVCRAAGIGLYLDGARLAYALACPQNDATLPDLARLCDAFYIGGTKNGTMFGEALVITRPELTKGFFRMKKRLLTVMEKGWIQGVQFLTVFEDDLYFKMGRQANEMAARLQKGLKAKGWKLWVESPTNQVFVIAPNDKKPLLDEVCQYEDWCPYDENHTVVRFVACFHTTEADVDGLLAALPDLQ